jgi:DNA-binding beta-propeller fold protein YncE
MLSGRHVYHRRNAAILALTLVVAIIVAGCSSDQGSKKDGEDLFLFFPVPPAKPRVQYVTSFSDSSVVAKPKSSFEMFALGTKPEPPQRITKPYGLAARDGVVYVCDIRGGNVTRVDFKSQAFDRMGTNGPGALRNPINMVIDPLGFKFVVDAGRKQVVVFGPDEKYARAFTVPEPCHPVDVAVWGNEIFVLDNDKTPQIVVFDRVSGKVIRTLGSRGKEPGRFNFPSSICIDPEGFLYVSDTVNARMQKLTREGEEVWIRGGRGYHLQQFNCPKGVRAGPDGIIYIVENAFELVKLYNAKGQILMFFGGPGTRPGSMLLPSSVAVDETSVPYFKKYFHKDFDVKYLLFVANQFGDRLINVYAFGEFPEGYQLSESEFTTLPKLPTPGSRAVPRDPIKAQKRAGGAATTPAKETKDDPQK